MPCVYNDNEYLESEENFNSTIGYANNQANNVLNMLRKLSEDIVKKKQQDLITIGKFLEYFSEEGFDIDFKDDRGRTLLHNAVQKNEPSIVELLVEEGADPNILDKDKYSPLGLALREE